MQHISLALRLALLLFRIVLVPCFGLLLIYISSEVDDLLLTPMGLIFIVYFVYRHILLSFSLTVMSIGLCTWDVAIIVMGCIITLTSIVSIFENYILDRRRPKEGGYALVEEIEGKGFSQNNEAILSFQDPYKQKCRQIRVKLSNLPGNDRTFIGETFLYRKGEWISTKYTDI